MRHEAYEQRRAARMKRARAAAGLPRVTVSWAPFAGGILLMVAAVLTASQWELVAGTTTGRSNSYRDGALSILVGLGGLHLLVAPGRHRITDAVVALAGSGWSRRAAGRARPRRPRRRRGRHRPARRPVRAGRRQRSRSLRPGWSTGRGPVASQWNIRSASSIGTSLMLACRRAISPCVVELPVLVAVGAKPVPGVVVPLVGESHRDPVVVERPQLLDQPVVQLLGPLPGQERDDLSRPWMNSARLRHRLSGVYASATRSGSRVFQPSSAARTFGDGVVSGEGWQRRPGLHAAECHTAAPSRAVAWSSRSPSRAAPCSRPTPRPAPPGPAAATPSGTPQRGEPARRTRPPPAPPR